MSDPGPGDSILPWGVAVLLLLTSAVLVGVSVPAARASSGAQAPYYPSARAGAVMVYDPVDGYIVLFGGSNGINDTWTFSSGRWTELVESTAPAPRTGACATWDSAAGYLFLFGGQLIAAGQPLANDTWEFAHGKWTQLHPALSPPPLAWAACTYDPPEESIVVFGGTSTANSTTGATWTFSNGQWNLQPVHETPRPIAPRFGAAMVYWEPGAYVDMYGGQGATSALNDSWAWIEGGWQEVNSGHPPAGAVLPSVAVNTTNHVGVLFGGATAANGSTTGSTWFLGATGRWSEASAAHGPSARFETTFAYDAADQYFVLYGGTSSTAAFAPSLNDTWIYSGEGWTNISASADRPPPPTPASSGSAPEVALIEYVVGGIALVAVVVAIVLYRRRRRDLQRSPVDSAVSPDPRESR